MRQYSYFGVTPTVKVFGSSIAVFSKCNMPGLETCTKIYLQASVNKNS